MALLGLSLSGLRTNMIFQVDELCRSYEQLYGDRHTEAELCHVALALAKKLRSGRYYDLSKAQQTLEQELFACALQANAFVTKYDLTLRQAAVRDCYLDCCCELALFNHWDWSPEQICTCAAQWRSTATAPAPRSELNDKLVKKFGLTLEPAP